MVKFLRKINFLKIKFDHPHLMPVWLFHHSIRPATVFCNICGTDITEHSCWTAMKDAAPEWREGSMHLLLSSHAERNTVSGIGGQKKQGPAVPVLPLQFTLYLEQDQEYYTHK